MPHKFLFVNCIFIFTFHEGKFKPLNFSNTINSMMKEEHKIPFKLQQRCTFCNLKKYFNCFVKIACHIPLQPNPPLTTDMHTFIFASITSHTTQLFNNQLQIPFTLKHIALHDIVLIYHCTAAMLTTPTNK